MYPACKYRVFDEDPPSTMLEAADLVVSAAFEGIMDKAGKPYVEHLRRVSAAVAKKGGNEVRQTIALLHDILEDTRWTEEKLRIIFPNEVVDSVVLLTKKSGQGYQEYIESLIVDYDAVAVKMEDLEDNMDLTRFEKPTLQDAKRADKYRKAHAYLRSWWLGVGRFRELDCRVKMHGTEFHKVD